MPAGAPVKDAPALDSRSAGISGSLADTGPGGSGKTRLAIEAAVELVPDQMPAYVLEVRRFARTENMFEYYL